MPSGLDSPSQRLKPPRRSSFCSARRPHGRPPTQKGGRRAAAWAKGTACSSKRPRGGPECRVVCNSVVPAAPLPSHGCRSGTGSDCARADAYTSSRAVVLDYVLETLAITRGRRSAAHVCRWAACGPRAIVLAADRRVRGSPAGRRQIRPGADDTSALQTKPRRARGRRSCGFWHPRSRARGGRRAPPSSGAVGAVAARGDADPVGDQRLQARGHAGWPVFTEDLDRPQAPARKRVRERPDAQGDCGERWVRFKPKRPRLPVVASVADDPRSRPGDGDGGEYLPAQPGSRRLGQQDDELVWPVT